MRLNCRNRYTETRIVDLYVNGQTGTRVALPPTGENASAVWIQARLDRDGERNILNFGNVDAITIESIDVQR